MPFLKGYWSKNVEAPLDDMPAHFTAKEKAALTRIREIDEFINDVIVYGNDIPKNFTAEDRAELIRIRKIDEYVNETIIKPWLQSKEPG